ADRRELCAARDAFAADMLPYLILLAVLLGAAGLVQIGAGLAPLEKVRRGVGAIRSGRQRRLADDFPDEVMPLVSEVNALLAAREQAVESARAWTADLAHGLKTPLAALAADAQRLRARGESVLAADLEQLAESMRRRVDRELIRARVRSGAETCRARADVAEGIAAVLRTLQRTPDGARLDWQVDTPARPIAAMVPEDLLELLGNLLENAAKWARARVAIEAETESPEAPGAALDPSSDPKPSAEGTAATASAPRSRSVPGGARVPGAEKATLPPSTRSARGRRISILIRDDGPGVAADDLPKLGQRGLRLDERRGGSGLGLAIARDVVDAYGGSLTFSTAPGGGLQVRVSLPAAPA
ncbi:MAG: HAMP domain-containing histidine kinase, partial [Thiohalocapsa sp.]|nr:HAMP domain-containing histidine kinase [Thiohalocapsa sp.]